MKSTGLHQLWILGACLAAAYVAQATGPLAVAADRIVLRNLTTLTDRTVTGFDPDGVRLDDGTLLTWDDIESARLPEATQAEFERLRKDLGEPLYRIRQRLSVGDDRGVLPHAEAVYPQYADRDSPTAYMVAQALMWGRLAVGRREEALEPYLRCSEYVRRRSGPISLPGERRLAYDPQTGLSSELLPVWFDSGAARAALPAVFQAIGRMWRPRPEGVNIYYATLALAAGEPEQADRVLGALSATAPVIRELREIVAAQRELVAGQGDRAFRRLEASWRSYGSLSQPVALYWLGQGSLRSSEAEVRRQGVLYLLRIPAQYGEQHADLAAAALYYSINALAELQDPRGSVAVRRELLERYSHTSFAGRLAAGSTSEAPKEN